MADHTGARHAIGVADRNGTTIDVQVFVRDAQTIAAVQHLNRKGFVQLPQVDVVHFQAVGFQQLRHGENGTDAHFVRVTACNGHAAIDAQRRQTAAFGFFRFHDDRGRGAV